jgi:hypothetical protein
MRNKIQHTLNTFLSVFRSVLHVNSGSGSADELTLLALDGTSRPGTSAAAASDFGGSSFGASTSAGSSSGVNAHLEFLDHPATKLLSAVLPNVLRTVTVVHSLWAPEFAQTLAPAVRGILMPSREHLAIVLGLGSAPKKNPKSNDPVSAVVYDVHAWLDHVRELRCVTTRTGVSGSPPCYDVSFISLL